MNYQALLSDNEELNDKNSIDGVTYDLYLVPTEHEAGEGEDSNKESIKLFETEISLSSQHCTITKCGCTIETLVWDNDKEFETDLMNYYILLKNNEEFQGDSIEFAAVGAAIGGSFGHKSELIPK